MGSQYSVCLSVQLAEMLFLGQLLTTALLLKFAFVEGQDYTSATKAFCASTYSFLFGVCGQVWSDNSLITWVDDKDGGIPDGVEELVSQFGYSRHYLVRAEHNGGFYPGTFMPNEGAGDIVVGGEVVAKSDYQLAIPNFDVEKEELIWRACSQEDGAFSVGQDKYGNSVYICQVREYGSTMFGVYDRDKNICTVPAGDRAISVPHDWYGKDCDEDFHAFSVLKVKEKSSDCRGCGPDSQGFGGAPKSRTPTAAVSRYANLGFANTGPDCWPKRSPCEARGGLCCPAKMRNGFESCKGVQKGPRCSAGRQYDDFVCPGSCGRRRDPTKENMIR